MEQTSGQENWQRFTLPIGHVLKEREERESNHSLPRLESAVQDITVADWVMQALTIGMRWLRVKSANFTTPSWQLPHNLRYIPGPGGVGG